MKKQTVNAIAQLSKSEADNLSQQVKESSTLGCSNSQGRTFSSMDLWNIHRQRKTLSGRRQYV